MDWLNRIVLLSSAACVWAGLFAAWYGGAAVKAGVQLARKRTPHGLIAAALWMQIPSIALLIAPVAFLAIESNYLLPEQAGALTGIGFVAGAVQCVVAAANKQFE